MGTSEELLQRDVDELKRVYPEIPKEKLDELVAKNKEMYPKAFPEPCPINT